MGKSRIGFWFGIIVSVSVSTLGFLAGFIFSGSLPTLFNYILNHNTNGIKSLILVVTGTWSMAGFGAGIAGLIVFLYLIYEDNQLSKKHNDSNINSSLKS